MVARYRLRNIFNAIFILGACARAVLLCVLSIVATDVAAMWERMSESELIARSDIVVTGELIGQSPVRVAGEGLILGVIRIDTVYKGPAGLSLAFLILPAADRPISSSDLRYRVGQSGLWFLRQRGDGDRGLYLADHPQRFTPTAQASPLIEALQKARSRQ